MTLHNRSRPSALPPPVAAALVYVGVVGLGLICLRGHFQTMEPFRLALLFSHSDDGSGLRWTSCIVSGLLVTLLWASWRGTGRGTLQTVLHLGASTLVLLIHFAVVQLLGSIPQFLLTPI